MLLNLRRLAVDVLYEVSNYFNLLGLVRVVEWEELVVGAERQTDRSYSINHLPTNNPATLGF